MRYRLQYAALAAAVFLVTLSGFACDTSDELVGDGDRLCKNGAGVAVRITGASPLEVCIKNDEVSASFGDLVPNRYDIAGSFTSGDLVIDIDISFFDSANLPKTMFLTNDPNISTPDEAYFSYRETRPGQALRTLGIIGELTLTFADPGVVVASFTTLQIDLEDVATQNPAGSRTISEGFINAIIDN